MLFAVVETAALLAIFCYSLQHKEKKIQRESKGMDPFCGLGGVGRVEPIYSKAKNVILFTYS
jgi:hypothetical protein